MGLKDLFVQKEEQLNFKGKSNVDDILKDLPQPTVENKQKEYIQDIKIDGIKTVDEIFQNQNINNQNIYEVVAFIESLPQGMDIVAKKTSLKAILKAAKYNIDEMVVNAETRTNILKEFAESDSYISKNMIDNMNNNIASKLQEIEDLKQQILDEQNRNKQQIKLIDEEINRIVELKNYIV